MWFHSEIPCFRTALVRLDLTKSVGVVGRGILVLSPVSSRMLRVSSLFFITLSLLGCASRAPKPVDEDFFGTRLVAGDENVIKKYGFPQFRRGSAIPFEGRVTGKPHTHVVMIKLIFLSSGTPVSVSSAKAELKDVGQNQHAYSGILPSPRNLGPHTIQVVHPRLGVVDELVIYIVRD